MEGKPEKTVNVVLIGDGYVGKTSILKAMKQSGVDSQEATEANLYGETEITKIINNKEVHFTLIDTAGQEEYDELRKTAYQKAHIFILCFCVADKVSYENIMARWINEIQPYRNVPTILVGTKLDLRDASSANEGVPPERGLRLQRKIGAKFYIECSAVTREGLNEILDGSEKVLSVPKSRSHCSLQ